jgi:hypothetical protein
MVSVSHPNKMRPAAAPERQEHDPYPDRRDRVNRNQATRPEVGAGFKPARFSVDENQKGRFKTCSY